MSIKQEKNGRTYSVDKNGEMIEVVSMPVNKDDRLIEIVDEIKNKHKNETAFMKRLMVK